MICNKLKECFGERNDCRFINLSSNKIISCIERKKTYRLINSDDTLVGKLRIDDGCINTDSIKKCDYIFEFNDCNDSFIGIFIELKGSDFLRAVSQIIETLNCYSSLFNKCFARIVCSSGTRYITTDPKCIALKKRIIELKGDFRWFSNIGEDNISSMK